jgi:hypothetical protein
MKIVREIYSKNTHFFFQQTSATTQFGKAISTGLSRAMNAHLLASKLL